MDSRERLCFIGLKCLDHLVHSPIPRYLGGIERQFVALAEALAARGHDVTFITYDHGQGELVTDRGIRVIPSFSPTAGLPLLRFLFPRVSQLRRAIQRAGVETVLQMGAGAETGATAIGCIRIFGRNRKFVYCTASDSDCLRDTPLISRRRESRFYKFGLMRADQIVVQTAIQGQMLRDNFSLDADIITMPGGSFSSAAVNSKLQSKHQKRIIWIGRISKVKRLEFLLSVAKLLPDYQFEVVGDCNANSEYARKLKIEADELENVHVHGKVDEQRLADLYDAAAILCCTSSMEGLPTTFLEAWSLAIPVVTTFDPNNVVRDNGLGMVGETVSQIANSIEVISTDAVTLRAAGERCRVYFNAHHSAGATATKFESLLRRLDDSHDGCADSHLMADRK